MDKTLISGKEEAVEDEECENDTSMKVQPHDVEMVQRDSASWTAKSDEADELPERLQPDSVPKEMDNLCTVCGFSAKCPRSLKIHSARRHGRNSKNTNRTVKPAEKPENISDTSPAKIRQEADMQTQKATENKEDQETNLDELRSAPGDNDTNKKSSVKKETVQVKQQASQEEATQTQERRVSKRTPKPKVIHSCNYCGQEFWGKSPLELHIQRYHTKDTPYTCEYVLSSVRVEIWPCNSFHSNAV